MGRVTIWAIVFAMFCVPATAVFAGVGNGTLEAPPGLTKARDKQLAKIQEKIQKVQDQCTEKIAKLQELLDEALAMGDLEEAAELEQSILDQQENCERKLAKLQAQLLAVQEKFDAKIAEWQLKHGIVPPPPPDGEQPQ
jgi:chromosome segregation ATPase